MITLRTSLKLVFVLLCQLVFSQPCLCAILAVNEIEMTMGKEYFLGTLANRNITVQFRFRNDGDVTGVDEYYARFILRDSQKRAYLLDYPIFWLHQPKMQIGDFLHKGTKQVLIFERTSLCLLECDGTRIIERFKFRGEPETESVVFSYKERKPRIEVFEKRNSSASTSTRERTELWRWNDFKFVCETGTVPPMLHKVVQKLNLGRANNHLLQGILERYFEQGVLAKAILRVRSIPKNGKSVEFTFDIGEYPRDLTLRSGDFCLLKRRQIFFISGDMARYSAILDCDGTHLRRLYENGRGRVEVEMKRRSSGEWNILEYWSSNQLLDEERRGAHKMPNGTWQRVLYFHKGKFTLKP